MFAKLQKKAGYLDISLASNTVKKIFLSILFAVLTAVFAQIKIYFPNTPVPFTLQVVSVLLAMYYLGGVYGALSQIMYFFGGFIFFNWFAGTVAFSFKTITFGYIMGFVFASFICGNLFQRKFFRENIIFRFLGFVLAVFLIYVFGSGYMYFALGVKFNSILSIAVYPFILFDLIKIIAVLFITKIVK